MKRTTIQILGLCLVSAVMFAFTGVSYAASPEKPRIALVMKSLANEFFKTMEDGARADAAAHPNDYELRTAGTQREEDVEGQIRLVEEMIGQKVDALVIAPADSKALIPVCKRAADAGITVVNIDNKFDAATLKSKGLTAPFVGPDNRKGAKMAGDFLAKKLQKGDEVIIIEGLPTAFNAQQRKAGFDDSVKEFGLKLGASQAANWETDNAANVMGNLLPSHPQLKGVMCANDSMVIGAVSALKSANRTDVLVAGFDNIKAVQSLIREGRVVCTIDQHADQIAVFGIQHALKMLKKTAPPGDVSTPVDLITLETLEKK